MTAAIQKLEELANGIADVHKELASEIEAICAEDGVSEDHHPLHHSAQNILRLERLLSELVKAMTSSGFDGEVLGNDLKNIYLQRIIANADFKASGFARVLINAGLNKQA
jgi:hypothetical protein